MLINLIQKEQLVEKILGEEMRRNFLFQHLLLKMRG